MIFFEHYSVLGGFSHETLLCSNFVSFEAVKQWFFLSITVFRGLIFTKHCNAQKIPKFPTPKLTKHCNAQKIPKIPNFFGNLVLAWT